MPPSSVGWTIDGSPPSIGSVTVDLLDRRRAAPAGDLGAERQQVVAVGEQRRAVHGRQPGDHLDGRGSSASCHPRSLPVVEVLPHQLREPEKGGDCAYENRRDDRLAPAVGARRHDEQQAAAAVRAHRDRELHEHVDRVAHDAGASKPSSEVSSDGQSGRLDAFSSTILTCSPSSTAMFAYLVCSPPRCCLTTSRPGAATSRTRQYLGRTRVVPHTQTPSPSGHDAQMDAGALDRRRHACERGRRRAAAAARTRAHASVASGGSSASEIFGT